MPHDDFAFEPIKGLPGPLPEGEEILWQGAPDPWRLAVEALVLKWITVYFLILVFWRIAVSSTSYGMADALGHAIPLAIAGLLTCSLVYAIAWIQARATVYTLTNKRVAMRIGAALTLTLNLPLAKIGAAHVDRRSSGTGTIAFETLGSARLSYLMTWPHVRPWTLPTQAALRCIKDVDRVAELFADTAQARLAEINGHHGRTPLAAE